MRRRRAQRGTSAWPRPGQLYSDFAVGAKLAGLGRNSVPWYVALLSCFWVDIVRHSAADVLLRKESMGPQSNELWNRAQTESAFELVVLSAAWAKSSAVRPRDVR